KEKAVGLRCVTAPGTPDAFMGDSGRIRQILINLIGNALKFTERGEVTVEIRQSNDHTGFLHFAVQDSGIGIPLEKLQTIFDAFAQADGSTTRRYGGTGLGLSICRKLTELMSGNIWVQSEVGKGSTFHFTVHLERQVEQPTSATESASDNRASSSSVNP